MGTLDSWSAIVDFPDRALYLRPPLATVWPQLAGAWAVTSWQSEGAARKFDAKTAPTFTFADRRLKLTDGGETREFALRYAPSFAGDCIGMFDPKQDGNAEPEFEAGGRIKVKDGVMTLCLNLGKGKDFPAGFSAPKGSGYVLLELKRTSDAQKPSDPLRDQLLKEGYTAVPLDREPDGTRMTAGRVGEHDLRLMVDTGATVTAFDTALLNKLGAKRMGATEGHAWTGKVKGEMVGFRGLRIGGYDTRRAWVAGYGAGFDLTGMNEFFTAQKRRPIQGLLGNFDLLNGSAVIDFGTNTLYLRPVRETLWPQLAGKWVGVAWESDGQQGKYAPGRAAIEFKDGKVRFTSSNGLDEYGFHLRDDGLAYQVGLFDPKADELAAGFKYASTGLLKVAGGTLTLVMQRDQIRKEPTEFAAPAGSGLVLVEYERAK